MDVYRCESSNREDWTDWQKLSTTTAYSYTDSSVVNGTWYQYRVYAQLDSGNSVFTTGPELIDIEQIGAGAAFARSWSSRGRGLLANVVYQRVRPERGLRPGTGAEALVHSIGRI